MLLRLACVQRPSRGLAGKNIGGYRWAEGRDERSIFLGEGTGWRPTNFDAPRPNAPAASPGEGRGQKESP